MKVIDVNELRPCLSMGFSLIPIKKWDSMAAGRSTGKAPRDKNWVVARYSKDAILNWIREGGNIGIRLSKEQLVIDVDPRHEDARGRSAEDLLDDIEVELGVDLSSAPAVKTGGGGLHVYLLKPEGVRVRNSVKLFGGAVEFKSYGRQVLAPGSKHPNTKTYKWWRNAGSAMLPCPDELLSVIAKPEGPAGGSSGAGLSLGQVRECLAQLDPTQFRDYEAWRNLLFSVHYACSGSDEGLEVFTTWSTGDPQYASAADSIASFWEHASDQRGDGRTDKTLLYYVVQAGGKVPVDVESLDDITPPPEEEDDGGERELPKFARNKFGQIKHTIADNVVLACRYLGVGLVEDVFSGKRYLADRRGEVGRWFGWVNDGDEYTDQTTELVALTAVRSIPGWSGDPAKATMKRAKEALAKRDHPLQRWLSGLKWDGKRRLDTWLMACSDLEDNPYNRTVSRLLLTAAVTRAMRPGVKFDAMVILEGPQGGYKSTLIRWLGGQWAADGLPPIGGHNYKDVISAMRGKWLIEIDELASMRKSDVDVLKSFISRQEDRVRLPYEEETRTFKRQCVFIGTTNDQEYLRDITGNRRFLPLAVGMIHDVTSVPRLQLWAEAMEEWRADPDIKEVVLPVAMRSSASYIQESRRIRDPWEDRLEEFLEVKWQGQTFLSTETIFFECFQVNMQRAHTADSRRLAQVMQKLGWERHKTTIGGRQVRGYQKREK